MGDWLRAYLNGRVGWGYLVDSPDASEEVESWLNKQGRQGWELVAVRSNGSFIFKRGNG